MRRRWAFAILAGALAVGIIRPSSLEAERPVQETQVPDATDAALLRYGFFPAFQKLGRGVANTFLGWTEVPLNIDKRYIDQNTGESFMYGAAVGAVKGAVRTGVGLYEILTFWLPYPQHFAPVLPPLDYFKHSKDRPRRELPLE